MATKGRKKIDTFNFRHERLRIDIPIYLVTTGLQNQYFQIVDYKYELNVEDPNIQKVKEKAEEFLKKRLQIQWTSHLRIEFGKFKAVVPNPEFDSKDPITESEAQLHFEWQVIYIGEVEGKRFYKDCPTGHSMPLQEVGLVESHGGFNKRCQHVTRSIIPDTPESRKALVNFSEAMEQVGMRIEKFMAPAFIEKMLQGKLVGLLSAPKEKP